MEETLGKRICKNRKRLGLTQDQMAEKLGVTAQAVSKWENDQSCPDIAMLPKLAKLFHISTDALLGCTYSTQADGIQDTSASAASSSADSAPDQTIHDTVNTFLNHGKKATICLGIFTLVLGTLFLMSQLLSWKLSFWDILWPTALLCFGLFGMVYRFSFFTLGCILLGGYFLAERIFLLPFRLDGGILLGVFILIFGSSILADTLQKKKKVHFPFSSTWDTKSSVNYETKGNSFSCSGSFSSFTQVVTMPLLEGGTISNAFGEMTIDLSEVDTVSEYCTLNVSCNFGALKILIPRQYMVKPVSSTAFAGFTVNGHADAVPKGYILMDVQVHFGEVKLVYI